MKEKVKMEGIDYEAVLTDLRIKRDELNTTIATIEKLLGMPASTIPTPATALEQLPKEVQPDSFFSMSAVQAAKKFLKIVKRPATMKEIHDALLAGGFVTTSKSFYSNLYTSIIRSHEFRKVHKKWGLVEWYGNRPAPLAEGKKKRRPRKKSKRSTSTKEGNEKESGGGSS